MTLETADFINTTNFKPVKDLPSAFSIFERDLLKDRKPVIFLDFDGTLTPIVDDPNEAWLGDEMEKVLNKLQKSCCCAVLTGRDRADIEKRVNIDGFIFAGSHGYDIKGPEIEWIYEGGKACLPALDTAERELNEKLKNEKGVTVERKKFAIAVHYRQVADDRVDKVLELVNSVISKHRCLKPGPGKKVMELKPDIEWHKGKALNWLMKKLDLSQEKYIPVFIGDDLTDEDGFKSVLKDGIGIIVGNQERSTQATYSLKDTKEVAAFLNKLAVC